MSMKNLPIGLQTFSKLIEDNCYYVDKTALIARLAKKDNLISFLVLAVLENPYY